MDDLHAMTLCELQELSVFLAAAVAAREEAARLSGVAALTVELCIFEDDCNGTRASSPRRDLIVGLAEPADDPAPLVIEREPAPDVEPAPEPGPDPTPAVLADAVDLEILELAAKGFDADTIAEMVDRDVSAADVARRLRELRMLGGVMRSARAALQEWRARVQ